MNKSIAKLERWLRDFENGVPVRIEYRTNFEASLAQSFRSLIEAEGYEYEVRGNLLTKSDDRAYWTQITKIGYATMIPLR